MLIRTYKTADRSRFAARIAAADPGSGSEYFIRDEGDGAVELIDTDPAPGGLGLPIEGDPAPAGSGEMQATTLFTGGEYGDGGGPWLFMVGLWTPEDFRDEFVAWYRIEHMPILLECPLWDGCRFVETKAARGCQFYSLHQLNDRAALDSAERKRSRSTPWFRRLSQNDWFDGAFTRTLYRRPE